MPSKIIAHIIFSNVIKFIESNNLLNVNQHGFMKGRSCETQLLEFVHNIHSNLEHRKQVDAIFLDFAKAFDRVPHSRLLTRLTEIYKIRIPLIQYEPRNNTRNLLYYVRYPIHRRQITQSHLDLT
uniref:Putative rte all n=1 Tax=Ixodes ricinus TaxID=34613 RepID=A0A0K8RB79_IXORI